MKIIKRRQFATVDPATEEVITMVAEADRLASRSFSCLLEYKGCSHNLSDVRFTIFTNNGTSSSTIFENLLREIRKKKKSIKSLQMHACIFSRADVDLAVGAARAAFKPGSAWRKMDASGRGRSWSWPRQHFFLSSQAGCWTRWPTWWRGTSSSWPGSTPSTMGNLSLRLSRMSNRASALFSRTFTFLFWLFVSCIISLLEV